MLQLVQPFLTQIIPSDNKRMKKAFCRKINPRLVQLGLSEFYGTCSGTVVVVTPAFCFMYFFFGFSSNIRLLLCGNKYEQFVLLHASGIKYTLYQNPLVV